MKPFSCWRKKRRNLKKIPGGYDRKGNFLYQPYLFDNGADYFCEGVRRFVKMGKIGFVDRMGRSSLNLNMILHHILTYGYAVFCDGCDWEKTDDEHKRS
jgi:hypothetical protein